MSDPAIKLFGKTIPLPEVAVTSSGGDSSPGGGFVERQDHDPTSLLDSSPSKNGDDGGCCGCGDGDGGGGGCRGDGDGEGGGDGGSGVEVTESEKEIQEEKVSDSGQQHGGETLNQESTTNSEPSEKPETPKSRSGKPEEETQNETGASSSSSQETKLKKPDKILPCPRCNSMDTKFCYYNNYNVNQPRHFCKNCQRYWTAGGTMRNVPVGAGRRKNKNSASASHYNRHINISAAEAMQKPMRTDLHHHPNGTSLLTFGSDALLCESMASGLNLADKAMLKPKNGFHEPAAEGLKIQIPYENNVNISQNPPNDETELQKIPCFPAWPYTWNGVPWTVLPVYPPPSVFWNCPAVPPATWNNFQWMAQPTSPSGSGPNSPTLGKHSREENTTVTGTAGSKESLLPANEKSNPERCLWVPKTLRVDDPEEAAKSSIWETLGIKNDEKFETFRAFRSNNKEKSSRGAEENVAAASPPQPPAVLQANPAALSRSANFHESS